MLNSARREALEVVLQKKESVESTCWFWVDYERGSAQSTPSKTVIYFHAQRAATPLAILPGDDGSSMEIFLSCSVITFSTAGGALSSASFLVMACTNSSLSSRSSPSSFLMILRPAPRETNVIRDDCVDSRHLDFRHSRAAIDAIHKQKRRGGLRMEKSGRMFV